MDASLHGKRTQGGPGVINVQSAPISILVALGGSQGGAGRHKCVVCAYQQGRAAAGILPVEAVWDHYDESGGNRSLLIGGEEPVPVAMWGGPLSSGRKLPYLERERLYEIGLMGELLVVEHEKRRLTSARAVA